MTSIASRMMLFRMATRSTSIRTVAHRFSIRPTFFSTLVIPPPPTSNHKHKPLVGAQGSVIYTETDEAPALATYSLLPVISKV
jgi:hypothetical protein